MNSFDYEEREARADLYERRQAQSAKILGTPIMDQPGVINLNDPTQAAEHVSSQERTDASPNQN